ncbi:MAG: flagellar biosynthetic protein FliR [bacterium]
MIISLHDLTIGLFIFARIAGLFAFAPLYNARTIPTWVKAALIFWLTMVLWYVVPTPNNLPAGAFSFLIGLVIEVAVGAFLGMLCQILFIAVQSAGELADTQMGLSVAAAFDPIFGASVSVVGRLTFYFALTVFIMLNGHHLIIEGLVKSFEILPIGGNIVIHPVTFEMVLDVCATFWITTIKIAAPPVMLIFLSDFAFGIVSRVAPQVNVFMLGFQVKPTLGLLGILFSIGLLTQHIEYLILNIYQEMIKFSYILR